MGISKINKDLFKNSELIEQAAESLKRDTLIQKSQAKLGFNTYYQENFYKYPNAIRRHELLYNEADISNPSTFTEIQRATEEIEEVSNKMYELASHLRDARPEDQWLLPFEDRKDCEWLRFISSDGETVEETSSESMVVFPMETEKQVRDGVTRLKEMVSGEAFDALEKMIDEVPGGIVPIFKMTVHVARHVPILLDFWRCHSKNSHICCAIAIQYTNALERFVEKRVSTSSSDSIRRMLRNYNWILRDYVASRTVIENERPEHYWGDKMKERETKTF